MTKTDFKNVDEYIAAQPESGQAVLRGHAKHDPQSPAESGGSDLVQDACIQTQRRGSPAFCWLEATLLSLSCRGPTAGGV